MHCTTVTYASTCISRKPLEMHTPKQSRISIGLSMAGDAILASSTWPWVLGIAVEHGGRDAACSIDVSC